MFILRARLKWPIKMIWHIEFFRWLEVDVMKDVRGIVEHEVELQRIIKVISDERCVINDGYF